MRPRLSTSRSNGAMVFGTAKSFCHFPCGKPEASCAVTDAEGFAVRAIHVLWAALGAEAPHRLAICRRAGAAARAAGIECAEELLVVHRLVQIEHRVVQSILEILVVKHRDAVWPDR